jgi:hypothetical protein
LPDETAEQFTPHPFLRLWPPPPAADPKNPGEWDVTLRGTEEDFHRLHRALTQAGFYVDERGEYETYCFGFVPAEE